jgi:lipopolysaccharide biosynthesis regulator YciM
MVNEKPDSRMMASQIAQAKVAMAQATALAGKPDDALKMLSAVIDETPSSDNETHARANIALGNIMLAKQNKMEALMAFLKVDLLFFQYPEQRAEALIRLAKLWNEIPEPKADRANDARDRLQSLYPFTTVK